jgi:hypothetical protein
LNGRVYKTTLPQLSALVNTTDENVRETQHNTKAKTVDLHTKSEKIDIEVGTKVWYYVPHQKGWSEGYVTKRRGKDYTIQAPSGRYVHRNRQKVKIFVKSKVLQQPLCKPVTDHQPDIVPEPVQRMLRLTNKQKPVAPPSSVTAPKLSTPRRTPQRPRIALQSPAAKPAVLPTVTTTTTATPAVRPTRQRNPPSWLKGFVK